MEEKYSQSKLELMRELDDLLGDLADADDSDETQPQPAATLAGTIATPPATSKKPRPSGAYYFPVQTPDETLKTLSDDAVLKRLDDLCRPLCAKTGKQIGYESIREEVCSINLHINKQGLRPPAFRPSRKSPPVKTSNPVFNIISRDRMIIDLHWLHSRGYRRQLHDIRFRDFLTGDDFNVEMAEQFATESWSSDVRVNKIMLLSDVEQWQMGVLRSKVVWNTLDALNKDSLVVNRKLRSAAERTSKLLFDQVDDFTQLWIADQMCSGKHHELISRVHGWMRGNTPLTKATMSAKLKRMRARTANI